jgi:predicted DNA-binding transcriptional regulator YafY
MRLVWLEPKRLKRRIASRGRCGAAVHFEGCGSVRTEGVGQRSGTETIVELVHAFLDERSWSQAELARKLHVSTAAIKKRLEEMQRAGFPMEREEDHPHVWWSVPKGWIPGGVAFSGEELVDLLRILGRTPRGKKRDRLLARVVKQLPKDPAATGLAGAGEDGGTGGSGALVPPRSSEPEEQYLSVVEDAATSRTALRLRYFTASRGKEGSRHASVQRVLVGPPGRFIARCHRTDELKWFRIDNMFDARLDPSEPYRPTAAKDLAKFQAESLDGFHAPVPSEPLAFFVRDPEARWVARNLLEGMRTEEESGGLRVLVDTTACIRVARYVVALGAAATPETPSLAAAVREIAEGALKNA